jgi:hypothetical protein
MARQRPSPLGQPRIPSTVPSGSRLATPNKAVNLTGGSRCSLPAGYRQRYAH